MAIRLVTGLLGESSRLCQKTHILSISNFLVLTFTSPGETTPRIRLVLLELHTSLHALPFPLLLGFLMSEHTQLKHILSFFFFKDVRCFEDFT